jgi:hypothetical protein
MFSFFYSTMSLRAHTSLQGTCTFLPKILKKISLSQNHINPVGLVIKHTSPANLSKEFPKNLPGTNGLMSPF